MTRFTSTLLLSLFGCVLQAAAQQYVGNVNACVTGSFYDARNYHWLAYPNNCTTLVTVTFVSLDGRHGGTLDIRPGKSGSLGWSQSEVDAMGGVETYACPEHYYAVDPQDRNITRPVPSFRCKYRGF